MNSEHTTHTHSHAHATHDTVEHPVESKRKTSNEKHPRAHPATTTAPKKSTGRASKTQHKEMA